MRCSSGFRPRLSCGVHARRRAPGSFQALVTAPCLVVSRRFVGSSLVIELGVMVNVLVAAIAGYFYLVETLTLECLVRQPLRKARVARGQS